MHADKKVLLIKKILYTLCFVSFCVIDQIRGSMDGATQMAAVNCIGFAVGVIILSAYKWQDFKKPVYLVWLILSVIGGTAACIWGRTHYIYRGKWITGVIDVCLYGFIVIRIFYKLAVEKDFPKINWKIFAVWGITMFLMVISRDESLWPFWFLVMFGSFYLTEYSEEEKDLLVESMLNGLMIGFFLIQGLAFVFRPYDQLRYCGMYANTNINGLFYALTYAAFLGKWYQLRGKGSALIWRVICAFFAGAMFGFVLLTMGRTALLTMLAETVLFLFAYAYGAKKKRVLCFARTGVALLAAFVASFFLVFACVRYLPPLFHHPIWFNGEYSEKRVHSWDPIDSEKYIDLDEFWDKSLSRMFWFLGSADGSQENLAEVKLVASAAESDSKWQMADAAESDCKWQVADAAKSGSEEPAADEVAPGSDKKHPVIETKVDKTDPRLIRGTIYKRYWKSLNLRGHGIEEQTGFWLTPDYHVPHAHNVFLDMAYRFGVLAGIGFICIAILQVFRLCKHYFKAESVRGHGGWRTFACMGIVAVFLVFGMLEMDWTVGQNVFTLFFVILRFAF